MGVLKDMESSHFIANYWQKQPLLIREAMDPALFPVSPDELAGLACEPEVESRLVIQHGPAEWQLAHGPFDESDFATLPESHWTLLVQDVDKLRPDVGDLLGFFDFLPGWRIDDVMISFATDQGGVGPHRDAYDVFLIQGSGRRRWRLGRPGRDALIPGLDLRILADFDTAHDWLLDPGDLLYLPPGVAHWGTAVGDCMTYSVGFRTVSQRELAAAWFQYRSTLAGDSALDDSDGSLADPGTIDDALIDRAQTLVDAVPDSPREDFAQLLGTLLTEPKAHFRVEAPETAWEARQLTDWLAGGGCLVRHPWVRFAWHRLSDDRVCVFCNGESACHVIDQLPLIRAVCAHRRLTSARLAALDLDRSLPVLLDMLNRGWLETGAD
ncbi:MAG: cupin domain-containing protein [Chromatiaceae bacterium]